MTTSERLSADELEIRVQERTAELEKVNRALRTEILERKRVENELIKLKEKLEVEVRNTKILHGLSTQYIEGSDSDSLFQNIVEAAIAITKADKGNIQILDPSTGKLKIAAQRGFDLPFLEFFEFVDAGDAAACGIAMERLERVIVEDITLSPIFLGNDALGVLLNEDVRAVQSTPMVSRSGQLLGIVSTHFSRIHTPAKQELILIDILARQVADIIERRRAEEALCVGEELLNFALETSHTGAWDLDLVDHTANRSLEHDRIFGYEQLLPQWTYEMFLEHVLPEDRAMVDEKFHEAMTACSDWNFECRIRRADGEVRWIWASGRHRMDATGNVRRMSGIVQDITERKQAEEALKHSEKQYRTLGDTIPYGVWLTDAAGYCTFVSTSFLELVNMSMEQVQKFGWLHLLPPEDVQPTIDHWLHCVQTGEDFEREHRFRAKDGTYRNVLAIGRPIKDEEGQIAEWVGFNLDITERKQMEDALKRARDSLEAKVKERTAELENAYNSLKESERSLAEAQKMAHLGNWNWDIVSDKIYCSDEFYRILGISPLKSLSHNDTLSIVHPDDKDCLANAIKEALNGKPYNIDYRIILDNGEERIVHSQAEVIFDEKSIPVQIRGIVQDITERKRAEEKIKTLADAVESSDDAIITESFDGIITSWNKAAEQIYGYSAEEILGKSVSILEPDDIKGEIKQLIEKVQQGDKIQHHETLRLKKDGTIINVSITLSPIFNTYRKLVAISAIVRDITDRKKAENTLLKIETARKKEIHHRIKNNLQVISSLLDLQAGKFNNREYVKDSEILEAFRESQDRVISIALIHEELHEAEGTDTLDFSPYLEKLLGNLFHIYRLGNVDISLKTDLEENIFFDMDIAVPLGMVVNELVSNSLKYAFPYKKTGEIQIKLFSEESGNEPDIKKELPGKSTGYTLVISDDGAGIPEEIDFECPETLGLQLVNILVDQLDGKIELRREHGTEFIVRFSVEEKKN
ncbi:PAS domain S-box protein [Methanosarcina sp. T3]|uniref:PAS domain S-box protein n=1 Tax=Methanosarcina sp. T3 TaxID=3439062 RepID=UPI003F8520A6